MNFIWLDAASCSNYFYIFFIGISAIFFKKSIKILKIFGTSMIKGIRKKEFSFYIERCHAELKSYPGATAKELKHNIQFPIQIDTLAIFVIHVGCNDISPMQNQEKLTEEEIAKG